MTLKEKILAILKYEDRVTLVNILMKIPDREIAVSLMALNEHEKQLFFSFLGLIKARRVKEELQYQGKLDIRPDRYIKIVQKFLSYFEPGKKEYRNQSYIRPKRKR